MAQETTLYVPKRFTVLRFLSVALRVWAWIYLLLSLAGAASLFFVAETFQSLFIEVGIDISSLLLGAGASSSIILLGGLLGFLGFYAAGENISLRLATEENTRLAAALLLRMEQEYQSHTL